MRIKSWGYIASVVLSAISVAILFVIVVSPLLFWVQVQSIDTEKWLNLSKERVFLNYMELLHYLMNPFIETLSLSDIPVSSMGAFHFMEVKHLFIFNSIFAVAFIFISMKAVKWFKQHALAEWARKALNGCVIGLAALVCTIGVGFNVWFEWFHQIIFRNDAWLFDPRTDPVILVLPETFFLVCFVCIMLFASVYFGIVQRYLKHAK